MHVPDFSLTRWNLAKLQRMMRSFNCVRDAVVLTFFLSLIFVHFDDCWDWLCLQPSACSRMASQFCGPSSLFAGSIGAGSSVVQQKIQQWKQMCYVSPSVPRCFRGHSHSSEVRYNNKITAGVQTNLCQPLLDLEICFHDFECIKTV
jgi:hypothetical protein